MTQYVFIRRAVIAAVGATTFTLAACGGGTTATTGTSGTVPATTPAASTAGPADGTLRSAATPASSAKTVDAMHNDADITFAQMMIPHHEGAIAMAELAATRAASQQVKDLAATIKAAQGPEIEQMTSWMQAWGVSLTQASSTSSSSGGMGGMDQGATTESGGAGMPGMMTDQEMSQLTAATGAEFDRMFLQMMITHHQGAVAMAETELSDGANPDAKVLAESIKTSQTAEIATMQQLLQTL